MPMNPSIANEIRAEGHANVTYIAIRLQLDERMLLRINLMRRKASLLHSS